MVPNGDGIKGYWKIYSVFQVKQRADSFCESTLFSNEAARILIIGKNSKTDFENSYEALSADFS